MTEEFNLSDKVQEEDFSDGYYIKVDDVEEFIKRLKDEMGNSTRGLNNKDLQIFYKSIDKLAGPKFSKKTEEEKE